MIEADGVAAQLRAGQIEVKWPRGLRPSRPRSILNETGTTTLSKVVQLSVARPALRYIVLILAVLVTWGLSWIGFVWSDEPFYRPAAPLLAYMVVSPIWIVIAVLEHRRLIWRLLLVWVPVTLPVAGLISVALQGDNTGLGYLFAMLLVTGVGIACLIGSIAALVYRPGQGPLRPTQ
jgi:hypothetical protein